MKKKQTKPVDDMFFKAGDAMWFRQTQGVTKKAKKKASFKDHAAAEQEDRWRWSIESGLWNVLDRLLRREDAPMPHEARILIADLLKTLPLPKGREGRPKGKMTTRKMMWLEIFRIMGTKINQMKMSPTEAAEETAAEIKPNWRQSPDAARIKKKWWDNPKLRPPR